VKAPHPLRSEANVPSIPRRRRPVKGDVAKIVRALLADPQTRAVLAVLTLAFVVGGVHVHTGPIVVRL